jgi:integrase
MAEVADFGSNPGALRMLSRSPEGARPVRVTAAGPAFSPRPATKGGGRYVGLQKAWARIRAAAGLADVHLHDLRHTVGAVAASSGASLVVVGRMLGHRKARSTERYAHVAPDAAADAADRVAASIATAIGGRAGRR